MTNMRSLDALMLCLLLSGCTSGSPLDQSAANAATANTAANQPVWTAPVAAPAEPVAAVVEAPPAIAAPAAPFWPAAGSNLTLPAAAPGSLPGNWSCLGFNLQCNGTGLCEWGIFGIDLYRAGLYSERRITSLAEAIAPPQACVIHLRFVRSLTAAQLREAFTAATKVNTGDQLPQYEASLQLLVSAMRDVANNDSYTFYCVPDHGMLVARNDEVLQVIPDEAFRKLFLTLYLGDNPPTKPLREALLGRG